MTRLDRLHVPVTGEDVVLREVRIGDVWCSAGYSPDEQHRYALARIWDQGRPAAVWVMLNPSTATEQQLDPTVTRCLGYSTRWGFGSMVVLNLFAFRATDPKVMKAAADPVGPKNDAHLLAGCGAAMTVHPESVIIAAWGTHGSHMNRGAVVTQMLTAAGFRLMCLGTNGDGSPKHPLYLKGSLEMSVYRDAMGGRR